MRNIVKDLNNAKGTTLIEVLVASTLLTIVTVSLIAVMTQSAVFSKHIDQVYSAAHLAQMRIELLKRFDFDQLYPGAKETDVRIGPDGTVDASGDYMRTTGVYTNNNPYLLRVKVTVDRMVDGGASGHPVIMETYFADID